MSKEKPTEYERSLAIQAGLYLQPDPVPNETASMHDLVAEDLQKRKEFGYRKYGTLLQAGNGRDPLTDAYEEVLDHSVYLRQAIIERAEMRGLLEWGLNLCINGENEDADDTWSEFSCKVEEFLRRTSPPEGFDSGKPLNIGTKMHEMFEKYNQIDQAPHNPEDWNYGPTEQL